MRKILTFLILGLLAQFSLNARNFVTNGSFEQGLTTGWTHSVANGAKATFNLVNDKYVMDGTVSLRIKVDAKGDNIYSIKSTSATITLGADSIYLLRFWAKGSKRFSKMYVSIEGADTNRVLYEMHTGRQLFHLPFKTKNKNITVNIYPQDPGITYAVDGVEILDQNNDKGVDVLNTYVWNNKRSCTSPTWLAGDNDVSFELPDGRKMWFFNDSFYGEPNDTTSNPLYKRGNFIRNSYVLEEKDGTLVGKGSSDINNNGQRAFFEPIVEILEGTSQKNFYWLRTALMENDTVKVYLVELDETGGLHDTKRSYIAKFAYPSLEYLGIEQQADFAFGYELFYTENDTIYLFKTDNHLARTPVGNIIGAKPWEYWNGSTWVTDASQAVKVSNNQNDGVFRIGQGNYVQVAKPYISRQMQVSFASAPQGPWTAPVSVYTEPNDSAITSYMANIHSKLPNGKYSVSYSMNQTYELFGGSNECFADKYWYRQRYVQVDFEALSPYSKKFDCAGVENGTAFLDQCGVCVGGNTGLNACVVGTAILHSDCDYNGDVLGLIVGDYNNADLQTKGFTLNTLSSIKVEAGYEVVLFDLDSLKGNSIIINSSVTCLSSVSFDNKALSLMVRRVGTSDISGTYVIQNKLSGLYLGLNGESTANRTTIVQAKYKSNNTQHFTLASDGKGYYSLTNVASNYFVNARKFSESATIELWDGVEVDLTNMEGAISAQYGDSPAAEGIEKLTDNSAQTKFLTFHNRAWIQFKASKPSVITGYSITSANDADGRDPLNWSLKGSNDGVNWTKIDTLSNQDFPARFEEKSFEISNSTAYAYFRLEMVANVGDMLQLAEWKLFADASNGGVLDSKMFVMQDAGNETYRMYSKSTDKLLDVLDDGLYSEGTSIRQVDNYGQNGGLWKLIDIKDITSVGCDGIIGSGATMDDCGKCVGGTTGLDSCNNSVLMYPDCNFEGNVIGLGLGSYRQVDLVGLGLPNNSLSSLKVKKGLVVELYDTDSYTGKKVLVETNDTCLTDKSFDNKASSIIVRELTTDEIADRGTTSITVYPNPVKNQLFVSGIKSNCQFEVLNLQGQELITADLRTPNTLVDVSALPNGVFLLKVICGNRVETFKFLKQ